MTDKEVREIIRASDSTSTANLRNRMLLMIWGALEAIDDNTLYDETVSLATKQQRRVDRFLGTSTQQIKED